MSLRCGLTPWTLRKRIQFDLTEAAAGTTHVGATCSAPQIVDWGDCRRTLSSVMKALEVNARQQR